MISAQHTEFGRVAGRSARVGRRMRSRRTVERTLVEEVVGWPIVNGPEDAHQCPAAYWSAVEGAYRVRRAYDAGWERFSPTRSLWDCLEVWTAVGAEQDSPELARPAWKGNVRVVIGVGSKEIIVEDRSLAWALSLAIYQATVEALF